MKPSLSTFRPLNEDECARLLLEASVTVMKYPITTERLLEWIHLAGLMADMGITPLHARHALHKAFCSTATKDE